MGPAPGRFSPLPFAMRPSRLSSAALALVAGLLIALAGCDATAPSADGSADLKKTPARLDPVVVVADRGSGTISVIDVGTDEVVDTITLPGANTPEPMYVVYSRRLNRVFVGDRANDEVVAYDARDFALVGTAPATGIFHMWADENRSTQLWVVDNVNNRLTVLDPAALSVITTIPIADGVPHDVIVDASGRTAFVTVFVEGGADLVLQFDTGSFEETGRVEVGEDPHLSLTRRNDLLYVPNQGTNEVLVFDRETLEPVEALDVPGAHGAGMAPDGRTFYTTNLPGGGTDGLVAIDTRTHAVLGATDTPVAVPHNVAATNGNRKLYVTHSGPTANQVTVYSASGGSPVPAYETTVTVGTNPFGLAYVPR